MPAANPGALAALEIERRKRAAARPPIWSPQAGAQTTGYFTDAYEVFYGGRAGGGKSDLLLGLAGTQHYRVIIFRRQYTNSMRALIERSKEIYGKVAYYNDTYHMWRFHDGRIIELASMQYEDDRLNFIGNPHDLYGFDELPEFLESQYTTVIGWARSTRFGQRVRILNTGNPPTNSDGEWVIRRWAAWLDPQHSNPAAPGELRWFTSIDGKDTEVENEKPFMFKGEEITPLSRTFIPATLEENKYLAGTEYRARLQAMPEPMRSQLLYGDFGLTAMDDAWQTIPTAWIQAAMDRWKETSKPEAAMRALGVDVARGGRDRNAFAPLYGVWFGELVMIPGVETPNGDAVADRVIEMVDSMDTPIGIDVIGVGSSPYDTLRRKNYRAFGINNSAHSDFMDKAYIYGFSNIRAQSYWQFREALDPESGENICLPPDRELLADLVSVRYKVISGKYQMESKDDIKKRIGRSPDKGDAIVMAWHAGVMGHRTGIHFVMHTPAKHENLLDNMSIDTGQARQNYLNRILNDGF